MKRKFKQTAAILVMLITAFAFTLEPASAKTKTMTAYDEILVSGNIVYCNCDLGIVRVNKKTGKKKVLVEGSDYTWKFAMKKRGKWLYYLEMGPEYCYLCRVNKNTGKEKWLYDYDVEAYKVTKKKIYFKGENYDTGKSGYFKMKTNFKSVKKTSVKVKMKTKRSSRKGYKIIAKHKGDYVKCWLKTPKKKIYLGKRKSDY